MSAAPAPEERRREPWYAPPVIAAVHYEVAITFAFCPLFFLAQFLPKTQPYATLGWALPTALLFFLLLGQILGWPVHWRRFYCEHCTSRFPVDAPVRAEKHRDALVRIHGSFWTRVVLLTMGWIVGTAVLSLWLPLAAYLTPLAWLVWGAKALAHRRHMLLQPWCPICRRRDEDDDPIVIPVPTPPSAKVDS